MFEMQRELVWASLKSGIVISIALIILFSAIFFSSNIGALFSPKFTVNVKISNVQGLLPGAPVWLFGAEIGKVKKINVIENGVLLSMVLDKKHMKAIHKSATASIMTMGILGDKFVQLNQGDLNSGIISSGDTIPGKSSVEFEQITSAAVVTLAQMDSVVVQLTTLLSNINNSSGTFSKFLNDDSLYVELNHSAKSLSLLSNNLSRAHGSARKLIEDPELYNNFNAAAEQLASLMNRLETGMGNGGTASALINDSTMASNLRLTIASFRETANVINQIVTDIKNNPKKYFNIKVF